MSQIKNDNNPRKEKGKIGALRQKAERIPMVRRLLRNPGLKALSLVFAIILWVMVMSQTNPPRTKVVYDVPVELTGLSELNARGLSLASTDEELPSEVDVRLEVPMDDLSRVSRDNVHATIDLSRITTTGEHDITVDLTTAYGTTTSATVTEVTVKIESLTTSIVPVQVTTVGTLSSNYRLGKIVATPAQFQITGPESEVNRIAAAVVKVDLTGLSADYNRSVIYTLVDDNSIPVESANITSTIGNSISVSIPVYPVKELPITYESSTTGLLKEGYHLDSIEVAPSTVRVAAPQSVLDELTGIPVSTIDLEGVSQSFTVTLPLKKNSEIVWTDVSEVDVIVRVKEEEATKTFTGLSVTSRNLASGLQAELYGATVDIEVTMAKSALEKLTSDDISVYVDLSNYGEMADSAVPLSVAIDTDAESSVYALSVEKIIVKITKAS